MHLTTALDELTEAELLDHADEVSRVQRECEAQVLRIAVQHAIINNPETLDPEVAKLPGRERAKRFGGVGTPDVAEFAAAALGARLGISSGSAHSLMADALDLMIRLPQLWRRVEALEVKASYARFVARRTRDLTVDQASYVDERIAEAADGRIPWTRFEDLLTGLIVASGPEAAAATRAGQRRAPGRQPDPLHAGRHARLLHPGAVRRHRHARRARAVVRRHPGCPRRHRRPRRPPGQGDRDPRQPAPGRRSHRGLRPVARPATGPADEQTDARPAIARPSTGPRSSRA